MFKLVLKVESDIRVQKGQGCGVYTPKKFSAGAKKIPVPHRPPHPHKEKPTKQPNASGENENKKPPTSTKPIDRSYKAGSAQPPATNQEGNRQNRTLVSENRNLLIYICR